MPIGTRVIIDASSIHGTIQAVYGTGDETTGPTITMYSVLGDDANTYLVDPLGLTLE